VLHYFLSPTLFSPQQYLLPTSLPTSTEPSTPSSPMYIPILMGRSDWCPWSEALTMAVIGMNLFGHIAEHHDSQWGFDPGSVPTYPPVSIRIPCLKKSRPGTSGGLGMVRCFTFSSHNCHPLYAHNFLVWVPLNLDVTQHNPFTEKLSIFSVGLISTWLLLFAMNSSLFIVLPLVSLTMSLAGDLV